MPFSEDHRPTRCQSHPIMAGSRTTPTPKTGAVTSLSHLLFFFPFMPASILQFSPIDDILASCSKDILGAGRPRALISFDHRYITVLQLRECDGVGMGRSLNRYQYLSDFHVSITAASIPHLCFCIFHTCTLRDSHRASPTGDKERE